MKCEEHEQRRKKNRGEGQCRPTKVVTIRMESEFAARLKAKARERGVSLSRYLRYLTIADIENGVTIEMILAALDRLERQSRKLHQAVSELLGNVRVVDAND